MIFVAYKTLNMPPVHSLASVWQKTCTVTKNLVGPLAIRSIHTTPTVTNKFDKITRYAKPVDKTRYKAGDAIGAVKIPSFMKKYPEYEYETMFFKRQNRGLYGGLQRTSSNSVSEAGNKTKRAHKPNIVRAKLWSETLNKMIQTRVSTTVLRTITKEGGLDNYLTKDKPARVKTLGLKGWKLRYDVLKRKQLSQLPQVEKDGQVHQVYYIHPDGKRIIVGKHKLLDELWLFVKRDTYLPILWQEFIYQHGCLTNGEIVDKLIHYNFDFTKVTA